MNAVYKFPDESMLANLRKQREALLSSAVTYVRDGRVGTVGDRLREASAVSGIPLTLIEVETKK